MTSFGKGRDFTWWIGLLFVNLRRNGGLGFRPLNLMNESGKRLSRLGAEEGESLRKRVLGAKYGAAREGWDIQDPNYRSSRLWEGIVAGRRTFSNFIIYGIGSGEIENQREIDRGKDIEGEGELPDESCSVVRPASGSRRRGIAAKVSAVRRTRARGVGGLFRTRKRGHWGIW